MKIALTHTEDPQKHQFYINWLRGNEDIEIISVDKDDDEPADYDALVLSGGVDIHPELYNSVTDYPHAPQSGWKKDRDAFEKSILKSALEKSRPVLGICRGLQLVNVVLNGTLIRDLGNELNKVHKGNPDKLHEVSIEPGTMLHEIAGTLKIATNSAHHQAIDRLGDGLKISARSADGTVEAIEWKDAGDKPFLLAVQWHPERMFAFNLQNSPASIGIRERFIEAIKKSKQ